MGDGVIEVLAAAVNIFTTNADERESVDPLWSARRTKLNGNGSVSIVIAFDGPFEA